MYRLLLGFILLGGAIACTSVEVPPLSQSSPETPFPSPSSGSDVLRPGGEISLEFPREFSDCAPPPEGTSLVVRSVRWTERKVEVESFFQVIVIPKTTQKIEFAPLASALLWHREKLAPSLEQSSTPVIGALPVMP